MKNFFVPVFMLMAAVSQAQLKGFSMGPYAELALPAGNFGETHKNGIGAGLGADIRLGRLGITGSAGYMRFGGQTIGQGDGAMKMSTINAIPLRAGIKYRLAPALYAKLESGMVRFTGGNESALIVSPGIGVRLLGLELQAKYEIWSKAESLHFWGLKAGFNF